MDRRGFLAMLGSIAVVPSVVGTNMIAWYAERLDETKRQEHNGGEVLPAASVIKLLIALALVGEARSGRFTLATSVALAAADRVGGSDRFGAAPPGDYPAHAMLTAMLSLSDNTASNALLRTVGMARCNEVAAAHGWRSTRIRRRFYDWEAQRRGLENETTARESAQLLRRLAGEASAAGSGTAVARRAMNALLAQTDRETIPAALPGRPGVANKTGELPGIRNDVAIVGYGSPDSYVIAILDRYGGSRAAEIAAIRAIIRTVDRRLARR
jgi:beta-lactamase class A